MSLAALSSLMQFGEPLLAIEGAVLVTVSCIPELVSCEMVSTGAGAIVSASTDGRI